MVIGGFVGLVVCYFDAMISYAETAEPEYSGFKFQLREYTPFILQAIGLTLAGTISGWLIYVAVSLLKAKRTKQ